MTEEQANILIRKVTAIEYAINGDGSDRTGMSQEVRDLRHAVYGTDDKMGLVNKVNIMWRVHVWVLCTISGLLGFALKSIVEHWKL